MSEVIYLKNGIFYNSFSRYFELYTAQDIKIKSIKEIEDISKDVLSNYNVFIFLQNEDSNFDIICKKAKEANIIMCDLQKTPYSDYLSYCIERFSDYNKKPLFLKLENIDIFKNLMDLIDSIENEVNFKANINFTVYTTLKK